MNFFQDKCYIVTGASSGIGRATAKILVERGARVTAMARTTIELEKLNTECDGKMLLFTGDVSVEADCRESVRKAAKKYRHIDGLIHCAGVSMRGTAAETDFSVFRQLMDVNFFSMVYLYQEALPHIKATKGSIVAVSSMMGHYPLQMRSGYASAKHALEGFVGTIRLETKNDGIHVMSVTPGFVKTNISISSLTADGSRYDKTDAGMANGLPPEAAAEAILTGIEKRKRDVVISGSMEKIALFLSKWAPKRLDKILLKQNV